MSLRILFADDSMTAQNMGKKILSEAGYDVVAVSNGAAAVKKIAEQKPDIIILDVYMPGYSGLEVCEKVRGSIDTLKTPVLLTVGKMEPYKPEDANRVKADGVIIKPFEASDLLAIVKKFEERIGNEPPPPLAKPAPVVERFEAEAPAAEMPAEPHVANSGRGSMQPLVEVPDHMAGAAAFGDLLGSEPASAPSHFAVNSPSAAFETSVIVPAPPVPVSDYEPLAVTTIEEVPAAKEEPAAQEPEVEHAAPAMASSIEAIPVPPAPEALTPEIDAAPEARVAPVELAPEPAAEPETEPEPMAVSGLEPAVEAPHPQLIPVFKEPEAVVTEYAFEPTAMPRVDDIEIRREPALQETAEETTRSTRAELIEPGLIPTTFREEAQPHEPGPMAATSQTASTVEPEASLPVPQQPVAEAVPEVSDADFEARVAAAMAAYNHASEAGIPEPPAIEPQAHAVAEQGVAEHGVAEHAEHDVAGHTAAEHGLNEGGFPENANSLAATDIYEVPAAAHEAALPSFEYQPPVREESHAPVAGAPEQAVPESSAAETAVAAGMEAAIPEAAAAAAADTGADHHTIAQAVHRVMERLKPELVEEIMRELRSKK